MTRAFDSFRRIALAHSLGDRFISFTNRKHMGTGPLECFISQDWCATKRYKTLQKRTLGLISIILSFFCIKRLPPSNCSGFLE